LIKNGIPTEAMVASVIVDKHAWHKPLYRQAEHMALQGLPIDRSTLADWVGNAAAELTPVYERMKELLLASAMIVVARQIVRTSYRTGHSAASSTDGEGCHFARSTVDFPQSPRRARSTTGSPVPVAPRDG
jgi:hypothetical protein